VRIPSAAQIVITGNTSGTNQLIPVELLTIAGGPNVTLNQSGNLISISGPSAGGAGILSVYNVGQTTGQSSSSTINGTAVSLDGAGGVSVGMSAGSIVISGATGGGGGGAMSWYGLGNTTQNSSTTLSANSISLDGLGIISVGYSNGSIQISATTAQSNQTEGNYFVGNTTGQSSSSTIDARSVSVSGLGIVSAGMSAGMMVISATTAAQSNQSLGIYNSSNTTGATTSSTYDARSLSFVGYGAASVGQSNGSIQISVNVGAQSAQTLGIYASSQTTGQSSSSTIDARSMSIVGQGIISAGLSAGAILISATTAAQSNQTEGNYFLGNTTGQSSSSTIDARSVSVSALGPISAGMSAGAMVISAPSIYTASQYHWPNDLLDVGNSYAFGNIEINYIPLPVYVSGTQACIYASLSAVSTTGTLSFNALFNASIMIYTRNASTLSSVSSASQSFLISWQNNSTSSMGGAREFSFPLNINASPGDYWVGIGINTSTTRAVNPIGANILVSTIGAGTISAQYRNALAVSVGTVITSTNQIIHGVGEYSVSTAAIPTAISMTQITATTAVGSAPGNFHIALKNW